MLSADVTAYLSPLSIRFGAPAYARLSRADLLGPIWQAMRAEDWRFNLDRPRSGNLCRHFTRRACCFVQDVWADSPSFDPALPDAAVFEFWFLPDPGRAMPLNPSTQRRDWHAVTLCFTEESEPLFIDWMNLTNAAPTLWDLSHDEFLSRAFAH